ncbi:S9 family peptidase [Naumannella halotolerans]|uniref:S9 family peptidase n=1 Tax=Naumannella halotolerans TaxID=993414 RepID=UPI00370DA56A
MVELNPLIDTRTDADLAPDPALALEQAWGSWCPTMTPDASRVAFISDRDGSPAVWVQDVAGGAAQRIHLSEDPVVDVQWSADRSWLSVAVATDGGVRTQVWVVRPDGSDARCVAGSRQVHAELGPWARSGQRLVVTIPSAEPGWQGQSYLVNPVDGERELLAGADLIHVLDLSVEERFVVILDGRRGEQYCALVDRMADTTIPLLPHREVGSTEKAMIRPSPPDEAGPMTVYLVTDMGAPRRQLVAMAIGPHGWRSAERVVAARPDAELESVDADDQGRLLVLTWNLDGGDSEIELLDSHTGEQLIVPDVPSSPGSPSMVISGVVLSRDGTRILCCVDGPTAPRRIWCFDTRVLRWQPVTALTPMPDIELIIPTLEQFPAEDGLMLSGWLYRAPGADPSAPAMLSLHGGPEAQERPGFSPQHQALASAGITVFAPNIRGSSGFGRHFVHADDKQKRFDAFGDVLTCRQFLVDQGLAAPERIAVTGRSYGGYLTAAMVAFHPDAFAAGVNICGMTDLRTFYRDSEPWIAEAAKSKYGDPELDADLLARISPMTSIDHVVAPVLVVHGELDTNVPIGEAMQFVDALRERGRVVEYLELAGEGHNYRRISSRVQLTRAIRRFLTEHL